MQELEMREVLTSDAEAATNLSENEVVSSPCSYTLTNEDLAEIEIVEPTYCNLLSHVRISMGLIAQINTSHRHRKNVDNMLDTSYAPIDEDGTDLLEEQKKFVH